MKLFHYKITVNHGGDDRLVSMGEVTVIYV